jgi:hypothetical protein
MGAMTCHVCGEPLGNREPSVCGRCDRQFHLRHRDDEPGTDCGEVWISDQHLALEYACLVCLGRAVEFGRAEPPIASGH